MRLRYAGKNIVILMRFAVKMKSRVNNKKEHGNKLNMTISSMMDVAFVNLNFQRNSLASKWKHGRTFCSFFSLHGISTVCISLDFHCSCRDGPRTRSIVARARRKQPYVQKQIETYGPGRTRVVLPAVDQQQHPG